MKENMVTVVIPLYNGEKYIERCITSIINQSYKNIEIIVVDDNSPDNSVDIIGNILKSNSNIKYIKNTTSLGAGPSRNIGLKSAKSPYILFLDCDDWIDLNCIEKAMDKFKSNSEIDIVFWEIKTAYSYNKFSTRYAYQYDNIIDGKMALKLLSHSFENEYFLSPLLGCKLFKKEILDNSELLFPDTIYEDDMFTFFALSRSRKIGLVTNSCLYYYQHNESITHNFTPRHISDFFQTFNLLYKYIQVEDKEHYYKFLHKSLHSMIDCMYNNVSDISLQNKYKAQIFTNFYQNICLEEYYSYSFSLTI